MDEITRTNLDNILAEDRELQHDAFIFLLQVTDDPVDWAYDVWDEMVANLTHENNRVRAIAAQLLCNLAKSDPQNRMLADFDALLAVTKDKRFVTARHSLQALWKVGAAGEKQQGMLLDALEDRFQECVAEKNTTLIRYDIIQDFRNLYDEVQDEGIKEKASAAN